MKRPDAASILLALMLAACDRSPTGPGTPGLERPELFAVAVTGASGANETDAAINPLDLSRIAITWQSPTFVAWSADSGVTWQSSRVPGMETYQTNGDPLVLHDADGRAYSIAIAFDRPGDFRRLGRLAQRNGIFLNRSDDGGRTWRSHATPITVQPAQPGIPFEDKPAATVDLSSDPARRGTIHVAWTQFRLNESAIRYARSTDAGVSFSTPIEISDRPGSPFDTVGAAEGTALAIGPTGTVYIVWSDSVGIWLDRSTDGGRTFGADVLVARTHDMFFPIPGVFRANGFPSIDVDQRNGRVYVQWVDNRTGRFVPWITTSVDGGRTWASPRAVAGGGVTATADRFFSWLAVDRGNGNVVVGYYRSELPGEYAYYLAASNDGGASFQEWRWGLRSFRPEGAFIGDYTGIDAIDGIVHAVWTETELNPGSGRQSGQVWAGRAVFR